MDGHRQQRQQRALQGHRADAGAQPGAAEGEEVQQDDQQQTQIIETVHKMSVSGQERFGFEPWLTSPVPPDPFLASSQQQHQGENRNQSGADQHLRNPHQPQPGHHRFDHSDQYRQQQLPAEKDQGIE